MAYGMWQGLERASGNLAATGMNLLRWKGDQANQEAMMQIRRDQLKIAQDQELREKTAFEHAEKKRIEQENIDNAVVPASVVNPRFHALKKLVPQYVEIMKSAGFKITETPDEIYGSNKAFAYLGQVMKTSNEAKMQMSQSALLELQEISNGIGQQILQLKQSGKEDEKTVGQLQKLEKQRADIKSEIGFIIGEREKVMEQLEIAKAKPETTQFAPAGSQPFVEGKPVGQQIPFKETGGETKLTVWPTAKEAIEAGKSTGSIPEGKTVVAKPAKGGFIYDYESPNVAKETQERADKKLGADLRKEFNRLQPVIDYRNIVSKSEGIETAFKLSKTSKNFVAIDQALISLFNKITDPQSVVRESEYARTGQNMPIINSVLGKFEKWRAGGAGLTPQERTALVEISRELKITAEKQFRELKHEYRGYAKDYGLDPEIVLKEGGNEVFYMVGNDEYAIPKEKESAFLKKYPNAKRIK